LDWTRTLSANMVNEARLSYGRTFANFGGNSLGNTVPDPSNIASGLASITAPAGYAGFGYSASFPQGASSILINSRTTSPGRMESTR